MTHAEDMAHLVPKALSTATVGPREAYLLTLSAEQIEAMPEDDWQVLLCDVRDERMEARYQMRTALGRPV